MFRSRLENTGEDWSSLLVSLRELSDWVAKQEAELLGLGPVGGDENVIRKQQVSGDITTSDKLCVVTSLSQSHILLSPQNLFSIMIN